MLKNHISLTIIWLLWDLFPRYFILYYYRRRYLGKITLWINSFLSLLAIVSLSFFFFYYLLPRIIFSIFYLSLSRLLSPYANLYVLNEVLLLRLFPYGSNLILEDDDCFKWWPLIGPKWGIFGRIVFYIVLYDVTRPS